MTTISIERLVSSYNNETMILDNTYDDIAELVCDENQRSFSACYSKLKDNYIINGYTEQLLPSSEKPSTDSNKITYEQEIENLVNNEAKRTELTKLRYDFIKKYVKQNYILGLLFGNTIRKIAGERRNTLFLFPTYHNLNSKGYEKLNKNIEKNYQWIFKLNDFERFYLSNKDEKPKDGTNKSHGPPYTYLIKDSITDNASTNAFAFIPVFIDGQKDSDESFKQRIEGVFEDIVNKIKTEARYTEGQVVVTGKEKTPYTNICYMVNNEKDKYLFTDYYNTIPLPTSKIKILNEILNNFIQRKSIDVQNIRLTDVSPDPMKKLNKDYISKDLSSISRKIGLSVSSNDYTNIINNINIFIEKINDTYKKTIDKAYANIATSQSNISFMKLYYRVNNIDKTDDIDIIRTGNDFLYKLTGVMLNEKDENEPCNKSYICKLFEISERKDIYRIEVNKVFTRKFREEDKSFCSNDDKKKESDDKKKEEDNYSDEEEDEQINEHKDEKKKYFQTTIEIKKILGTYRFKKVDNTYSYFYPGTLEFYRDFHTNERYKWFRHNDINGSLSQETQIKYYQNILFDKISLIEYLKHKKIYNESKPNLGYEFLKINEDLGLLVDYSNYIYNHPKLNKTNINQPNLIMQTLRFNQNIFLEKIKKSILDIIFQPNQIIYIGGARKSSTEKKDTSQNYKVIGYTQYKTDSFNIIKENMDKVKKKIKGSIPINDNTSDEIIKTIYPLTYSHMMNISHGDENEVRYCPHRKITKCEIVRDIAKVSEERMIAIVDITRDVHDATTLKEKAKCKRLRKSIRLRMKQLIEPIRLDKVLMGRIIGGKKTRKKRRNTRNTRNNLKIKYQ